MQDLAVGELEEAKPLREGLRKGSFPLGTTYYSKGPGISDVEIQLRNVRMNPPALGKKAQASPTNVFAT